ncbi:MAG: hypothetical protein M3P06_22495 [Acidobacteriota bacterium]|nr:hypothetical protein [Acidobacteriota bacterium]
MRVTRTLLPILTLVAMTAVAEAPPTATLRLIPESTLPGIPASFLVTITNPAGQVLTLGNLMTLKATTNAGTFDVLGIMNQKEFGLPLEGMDRCGQGEGAPCLHIAANGQRDLLIDAGPVLAGNGFFADRRLMKPGTYDLELTLYEFGRSPEGGAIRTNAATLTVRQPTGVDLEVWKFLNEVAAPGEWELLSWATAKPRLSQEIQSRYPTSAYVPSVVSLGSIDRFPGDVSAFDHALAMNPPVTVRDNLLWHKAGYLAGQSEYVLRSLRDAERAVALADRAREAFLELQRVAISDLMRQRAAKGLSHLHTREMALQEIRDYERTDPPAPEKVIPRVECVTRGSGKTFTARFGYENPNKPVKMLLIGNLNQVTPAPRDQGQPRVFKPGSRSNVFTASSPGGNLTWHLDGQKAVAKRDFAVQCEATAP